MGKMITAERFAEAVGRAPVDDDLERTNCLVAGTVGHYCCGWCDEFRLPVFLCPHCINPALNRASKIAGGK